MRTPPIFLGLLLLFSCSLKEGQNDNSLKFLSKVKTVTLPLDEFSSYEFYNYQLIGDTLAVLNTVNYSVDFYNLSQEMFLYRIPIESQGEQGVPKLYSFLFHNPDTVFLFSQFRLNTAMIIDSKGNFIDRIKVTEFPSELHGLINHASSPGIPTYFFGNELHFSILALTDEGMKSNDFIQEYKLDITTGEFGSFDYIKKPDFYQNKKWVNESFSRAKLGVEDWYYSWNNSDTLFHIHRDDTGEIVFWPIVVNGGIPANPVPISENLSQEEKLLHTANSYIYGKFFLDFDRKLIHRIRYLPMDNPQLMLEGVGNAYLSMDFEVITVTMDGKYLGSTHFKSGKYDPRVPIFGKVGLYLPIIHPEYPNLQEDQIMYDVFQVIN